MAAEANIVIRLSDGREAGKTLKELRQDANRLTKEINNLTPGTDEFIEKSEDLGKVSGRLKEVREDINGVTEANEPLLDRFAQYVPFGGELLKIRDGFKALTSSTKTWGMALKAIPLILLISLIVKAVQWFMQTQAAMDGLTAVTRPLTAVFERFKGLMQELVGGLLQKLGAAFEDPKQAVIDLANAVKDMLISQFNGFLSIGGTVMDMISGKVSLKEGFKDLGNGVIQATTGMTDGIDKLGEAAQTTKQWIDKGLEAGTRLDELQKKIEITEINLTRQRAILNKKYNEANETAQDLSKTEDERLAAAKVGQKVQNQLLDMEQGFLDLKIEKMKLEQTLNDTSRVNELELAQLDAERTEFAATAAEKRASFKALENTINAEIAAEEKKRQDEIQKAFEERLKKELEAQRNLEDLTIEAMTDGMEKELAQIELETERKIEALIGSEEQITEQKALMEEQKLSRIAEVREKYRQEELRAEEQVQRRKAAIDQEILNTRLELYQVSTEAATDATDTLINLLGEESAASKAANVVRKAAIIAEVRETVQQQIAAADLAGAKISALAPPVTIPLGQAYAIAAKIAAVAGGAKRIAEVSKLEKGGLLKGNRHSAGGIPGYISSTGEPIEMEDGEIVLTRAVGLSPLGRRAASELNASYGGKRFDLGGVVNPFSKTTPNTTADNPSTTINLNSTNERLDTLNLQFEAFRIELSNWATNLTVSNNLQDTEKGLRTLNKLASDAGL